MAPVDPHCLQRIVVAGFGGRPPTGAERAGVREMLQRWYFPAHAHPGPLPAETERALAAVADGWEAGRLLEAFKAARTGVAPLNTGAAESRASEEGFAAEEAEPETLVGHLRHTLIRWPQSRPLRIVYAAAAAQLLLVVALLLLNSRSWPQVHAFSYYDSLFDVPAPILVATVVFLALAWSYVIAGFLHAIWWLRPAGVIAFLLMQWREGSVLAPSGGAYRAAAAVLTLALVLTASLSVAGDLFWTRRHRAHLRHGMRVVSPTLVSTFVCVLGIFTIAWMGHSPLHLGFTSQLRDELGILAILLVPALLLTGTDLAEMAQVTANRTAALVSRRGPALVPVIGLAAVLLAVFLIRVRTLGESLIGTADVDHRGLFLGRLFDGAMVVGIAAILALAVGLRRSGTARRIPYIAMVGAVAGYYGIAALGLTITNGRQATAAATPTAPAASSAPAPSAAASPSPSDALTPGNALADAKTADKIYQSYKELEPLAFSIDVPAGWAADPEADDTRLSGPLGTGDGNVDVVRLPGRCLQPDQAVAGALTALTASKGALEASEVRASGQMPAGIWMVADLDIRSPTRQAGRLWVRCAADGAWAVAGWVDPASWPAKRVSLDAIAESLTLGRDTITLQQARSGDETRGTSDIVADLIKNVPYDQLASTVSHAEWSGIVLVIAFAVVAALFSHLGRRWPRRRTLATGAVYLTLCATFLVFTGTDPLWDQLVLISQTGGALNLIGQSFIGTQAVVAMLSALVLLAVLARRRFDADRELLELLIEVNVALLIVQGLFAYFDQAQYGGLPFPEALIVLVALGWDVLMSGSVVTNRGSARVPRHARALVYFGYTMMVATLLLFFSADTDALSGREVLPVYNTEYWPQQGLIFFGVPLIMTGLLLNLVRRAAPRLVRLVGRLRPAPAAADYV